MYLLQLTVKGLRCVVLWYEWNLLHRKSLRQVTEYVIDRDSLAIFRIRE